LFEYDGTLFCGHDSGTFIIEKASVKIYSENQELGNLNRFPVKRALQGNYYGISVLEKVNNQWRFRNKITDLILQRYFEITDALEVYVSHEYKGFLGCS
jgi:hypothetical protein